MTGSPTEHKQFGLDSPSGLGCFCYNGGPRHNK